MPDIVGMSVDDATNLLAPLNVSVMANRVDNPNARFDRVLAQTPPPGTMLQAGDAVTYDVRASAQLSLPDSRRKVVIAYTVPGPAFGFPREVRIDVIDRHGVRQTVFPSEEQYRAGERPRFEAGSVIRLPLSFVGELTVEIHIDGERTRTYYYEGDNDPIITDHPSGGGQEEDVA